MSSQVEVYYYKVVYPRGTYIRKSPSVDAEKTGGILEFGTVFEASKSLFLDGVNYVKLADGRGWVFGEKGKTQVLDLLEITRTKLNYAEDMTAIMSGTASELDSEITDSELSASECTSLLGTTATYASGSAKSTMDANPFAVGAGTFVSSSSSPLTSSYQIPNNVDGGEVRDSTLPGSPPVTQTSPFSVPRPPRTPSTFPRAPAYVKSNTKTPGQHRTEQLFWRDVRNKARECADFESFLKLAYGLDIQPPPCPEPGPARSAWMANAQNDQSIRTAISLIASTTRVAAGDIVDVHGLEIALWVFIHLGASVSALVMQLLIQAADQKFDTVLGEQRTRHSAPISILYESSAEHAERVMRWRSDVLSKGIEIGNLIKPHANELAKFKSILPDEIRNFLQRWVIIKCTNTPVPPPPPPISPRFASTKRATSELAPAAVGGSSVAGIGAEPMGLSRNGSIFGSGGGSSSSWAETTTWLRSFVFTTTTTTTGTNEETSQSHGTSNSTGNTTTAEKKSGVIVNIASRTANSALASTVAAAVSGLVSDCEDHLRRMSADPDYQLAGIL